jgi:BirA family biotin operon repressor/biotin-[acetyl-CoA-carboxylase] ligase
MQEILRNLERWYINFKQHGFHATVSRWKELSVTLGKRVRVAELTGYIEGEAIDLDADGALLIRKDSGTIVKKIAGDITLVR